jgi:hypothetical protein
VTDREKGLFQLFGAKSVEKIALIFSAIDAAEKMTTALIVHHSSVVTGRDSPCTEGAGALA